MGGWRIGAQDAGAVQVLLGRDVALGEALLEKGEGGVLRSGLCGVVPAARGDELVVELVPQARAFCDSVS